MTNENHQLKLYRKNSAANTMLIECCALSIRISVELSKG